MDNYMFDLFAEGDGYRCELPGRMLIEAQCRGDIIVPLEDGGDINLASVDWYDSLQPGQYRSIKEIEFMPAERYLVRYMVRYGNVKLTTPYMFAVRVPA